MRRRALSSIVGVVVIGCSKMLSVDAPDVVRPSSLENENGARVLRAGAISRFTDAFSGGTLFGRGQVIVSGTIATCVMGAIVGVLT